MFPCPCNVDSEVSKSLFLFWAFTFSVICYTEMLSRARWLERLRAKKAMEPMDCSKEHWSGGRCENCVRKVRGVLVIVYSCGEVCYRR